MTGSVFARSSLIEGLITYSADHFDCSSVALSTARILNTHSTALVRFWTMLRSESMPVEFLEADAL